MTTTTAPAITCNCDPCQSPGNPDRGRCLDAYAWRIYCEQWQPGRPAPDMDDIITGIEQTMQRLPDGTVAFRCECRCHPEESN